MKQAIRKFGRTVSDSRYRLSHFGYHLLGRRSHRTRVDDVDCRWAIPTPGCLKAVTLVESKNPLLRPYLRAAGPGEVVLDIGANFGLYTIPACLRSATVVSFEPAPASLSTLLANVALNGVQERCTPFAVAIGAENGSAEFIVDATDPSVGTSHLATYGPSPPIEGALWRPDPVCIRVATRTVDSMLSEGSIPTPTMAKIDVEGHEASVLDGMQEALKGIHTIVLELHPGRLGEQESEETVIRRLTERGFALDSEGRCGRQRHLLFRK